MRLSTGGGLQRPREGGGASAGRELQRPREGEAATVDRDLGCVVRRDGEGGEARLCTPLEQDQAFGTATDERLIPHRARRSHAKLTKPEGAFHPHADTSRLATTLE